MELPFKTPELIMKKAFTKPTEEEITNYLTDTKNYESLTAQSFAERFWNYYESCGWKVGKKPMVSWHAAIRTWEINIKNKTNGNQFTRGSQKATVRFEPSGTGGY